MLRHLPLLLLVFVYCGCPERSTTQADKAADLQPAQPLPAEHKLLTYADLRLGMSNFDVAQVYNAPEGKGKGFSRAVEDYGEVRNQIIQFDTVANRPARRLVLRLYQDKLVMLVDRRDGLTEAQAKDWLADLKKTYSDPAQETLGGAQWVWGEKGGLTLTYTQDNASDEDMSANVVLVHEPSYEASKRYLQHHTSGS